MTPELQELINLYATAQEAHPGDKPLLMAQFEARCAQTAARSLLKPRSVEAYAAHAYHLIQSSAARRAGRPSHPAIQE